MKWAGLVQWIIRSVQSRWIWIRLDCEVAYSVDSGLCWIWRMSVFRLVLCQMSSRMFGCNCMFTFLLMAFLSYPCCVWNIIKCILNFIWTGLDQFSSRLTCQIGLDLDRWLTGRTGYTQPILLHTVVQSRLINPWTPTGASDDAITCCWAHNSAGAFVCSPVP